MRSRVQKKKHVVAAAKPALTIVPVETARQPAPQQTLNIVPAEENPAQSALRAQAVGQIGSQVLLDMVARLSNALQQFAQMAIRLLSQVKVRRAGKRLVVRESVSLGDKRFVAIVQVDGQQFLLGGAPNSVSMLAQLAGEQAASEPAAVPTFSHALMRQCAADRNLA